MTKINPPISKRVKAWAVLSYNKKIAVHNREFNDGKIGYHLSISESRDTAIRANGGSKTGVVPCTIIYSLAKSHKK